MKKITIIAAAIALVLCLGSIAVYAAGEIARSTAISLESAYNFAFVDAGVLPEEAEPLKAEFERKHGSFVYELKFTANGRVYEYDIDAASGMVIEKDMKRIPQKNDLFESKVKEEQLQNNTDPSKKEEGIFIQRAESSKDKTEAKAETQKTTDKAPEPEPQPKAETISVDQAKAIALKDAGLLEGAVTMKKAKLDWEDGRLVYEIEFYQKGGNEYEYDIDAYSGAIVSRDIEAWEYDD